MECLFLATSWSKEMYPFILGNGYLEVSLFHSLTTKENNLFIYGGNPINYEFFDYCHLMNMCLFFRVFKEI